MHSTIRNLPRLTLLIVAAVGLMFFGFLVSLGAILMIREWSHIPNALATVGLLWAVAGPVMLGGGLWAVASLGRQRLPLWLGGAAAILAGLVIVVGTLTNVIPCSGPN